MSESGWSETRVTTLSQLWLDGLSASQIAKQLGGVTRNAVIGKVHRLGLSGRAPASAPSRAPRTATSRSKRPRRAPPLRKPPAPPPVQAYAPAPEGPGLIEDMALLGAHACKWPIGDPKSPDFSFCGRPADGRYCAAHEQTGVR
ncbi:GcrA family cell cycle regulator, partial [Phenylobacterium sp.]|uniref:GcrA family cell cycle regulator n=1 Tax=Phenylobacterium sp. TaxID=1871053 RepID=UPI002F42FB83